MISVKENENNQLELRMEGENLTSEIAAVAEYFAESYPNMVQHFLLGVARVLSQEEIIRLIKNATDYVSVVKLLKNKE